MVATEPYCAAAPPQVGRAGRDGGEAACYAFLSDADFVKLRSLAFSGLLERETVREFLGVLFAEEEAAAAGASAPKKVRWRAGWW